MFIPAITVMLGAGQTALMVRSDFLRLNTKLLYLQVAAQYLVTALTLVWLHERAFILGWVVSYIVFAPVTAHRMLSYMNLPEFAFLGAARQAHARRSDPRGGRDGLQDVS